PPPTAVVKPTPSSPPAAVSGAAAASTLTPAEQNAIRKAYDAGIAAYRAGDYRGAIAAFDGIVKRFPHDPLSANAQYCIGDAWFNLRDFKAAASAQPAWITNCPSIPNFPDSRPNL